MLTHTDPAELPECSCNDDPSQHVSAGLCRQCGREFDVQCPKCRSLDTICGDATETHETTVQRFRQLLIDADAKPNVRFYIQCFLIAIGDPAAEGQSLAELAKRWRSTRAVASKYCREIINKLGIRPSPYMMSELSATSHKRSNKRQIKLK
jgi:hypothetical protein